MADDNGLVKEKIVISKMKSFIGLPDFRYSSTGVIGGVTLVESNNNMFDILGLPGTRIPHVWLDETRLSNPPACVKRGFIYLSGWSDTPFKATYERLRMMPEWLTFNLPVGHNIIELAFDDLLEIVLRFA
ncbi:hypothetical protein [Mucilaginibacter boryungensis]|uniref:Alpha/beta hydrolase family protein n=1 Tax=Mucilaginibacter boryungensis TaxID=768480 RepID=A0ABR9XDD7_9SPHI|nr:hypothetical protein [Mucilaginibacter boryungensis]MBE9665406.1 hypothetical protein [Mucilaginibacter boryungensis]